jgi:hypothetical protein
MPLAHKDNQGLLLGFGIGSSLSAQDIYVAIADSI